MHDYLTSDQLSRVSEVSQGDGALSVIYHIRSEEGKLGLPPCRLMAVELGPSVNPNKATLQIVVNKSVRTECKPVTNIEKGRSM